MSGDDLLHCKRWPRWPLPYSHLRCPPQPLRQCEIFGLAFNNLKRLVPSSLSPFPTLWRCLLLPNWFTHCFTKIPCSSFGPFDLTIICNWNGLTMQVSDAVTTFRTESYHKLAISFSKWVIKIMVKYFMICTFTCMKKYMNKLKLKSISYVSNQKPSLQSISSKTLK